MSGVKATITPDPPSTLGAGETIPFELTIEQTGPTVDSKNYRFGDTSRIEVGFWLDGVREGGFTVELAPPFSLNVPLIQQKK
jgi:hypothetical protein